MIRALIIGVLLSAASGVSALATSAGLRDIRAEVSGSTARLEISFSANPIAAELAPDGSLRIVGISATAARWELEGVFPITALDFSQSEGGLTVRPVSNAPVRIDSAALVEGDVHLSVVTQEAPFDPARVNFAPLPSPPPRAATKPAPITTIEAASPVAKAASQKAGSTPADDQQVSERSLKPAAAASTPLNARSGAVSALREAEALELISEGVVEEASCQAADAAMALDSWDIENLRLQAVCHAQRGQWRKAEESYDRILAFAPDDPTAHMGLSVLAKRQNNTSGAEKHLAAALGASVSDGEAAKVRLLREALLGQPH